MHFLYTTMSYVDGLSRTVRRRATLSSLKGSLVRTLIKVNRAMCFPVQLLEQHISLMHAFEAWKCKCTALVCMCPRLRLQFDRELATDGFF